MANTATEAYRGVREAGFKFGDRKLAWFVHEVP
jgi:hypothetical protein